MTLDLFDQVNLRLQSSFEDLFSSLQQLSLDERVSQELCLDLLKSFRKPMGLIAQALDLLNQEHLINCFGNNQIQESDIQSLFSELEKGVAISEILKISEHDLSDIYRFASQKYSQNHFEEARCLFVLLVILNPIVASFWYGWGASSSRNSEGKESIIAFLMAYYLEPEEFKYYFALLRQLKLESYDQIAKEMHSEYSQPFNEYSQKALLTELMNKGVK